MSVAGRSLTFTLDLEDHRPDVSYPKRYPEITREILGFLEEKNIKSTVFVLGSLAEEEPDLIKYIAGKGHEIAYHTHSHVHLTEETPERFRTETERCKKFLEDLTGKNIYGFRAPAFSMTGKTLWVLDILKELGFQYSSSVLPANNPIFGFPGAPVEPFRWPNGLLEIPAPIFNLGPVVLPFLGGFYLRYLPVWLIDLFLRYSSVRQSFWTYCHPHDFDYREPFFRIRGTSWMTSVLLWFNRRNTLNKLKKLYAIAEGRKEMSTQSFIEQIRSGVYDGVSVFDCRVSVQK